MAAVAVLADKLAVVVAAVAAAAVAEMEAVASETLPRRLQAS